MLTPEEQDLLQRHVSIDGDGNVIGNNNTVRVTKFIKNIVTSPWVIVLLLVGVVLLGITAFANLPSAREQLPAWSQPRAFPKERKDEVLIVIATFHHTEGIPDTAAHDEIKRAIERVVDSPNIRVEVAPASLRADDREGAQALGERYNASLVIWGADTGVRVSVNFYNRKQPQATAADVQIEETTRTQLAAPSEYAEFITQGLPQQLTFLALFAVGQSYYAEEAYVESARVIEQAVAALEQQTDVIEGTAEAYFLLGWLYQAPIGDLKKAQAAYTRALVLDPEYAEAYYNRGITYNDMGEYEQALADYTRALELNPEDAEAYNNRGIAYYEMGEYEQAVADYTRALKLNPDLAEAYTNRGVTYNGMGEYEQALADYNRALNLNPELAEAYYNRGNIYKAMGEYEQALADYTRALKLNPDLAVAYTNRGVAYHDLGEYEQALTDYNRAIELNPDLAEAYNNRGSTYAEMGEYEQAVADFDRLLNLNPEYAEAYYNRGNIYEAMGKYEQSLADYTRAIELNPEYAKAYHNRGLIYNDMGEYKQALADFECAADLMTHPIIYYNVARAHALLGHVEEACTWLENAIVLDSQYRDYARADPDFDPIRDAPCFQALMEE